jgi:hypothetical protein
MIRKSEKTPPIQLIQPENIEIIKVLISFFTMTESIVFENINKEKVRKNCKKIIAKHQRNLIINTGLTRVERLRLWYHKT